mgnify:FL=1
MKIGEILAYLDKMNIKYCFSGDETLEIHSFCPLKELKENSITWARKLDDTIVSEINNQKGLLIFIANSETDKEIMCNHIMTENPHRTFFQVLEQFFYKKPEINPPRLSVIDAKKIGNNTYIGELCYVGPDVIIGEECVIGNNVTIEGKVTIGNHVIIDSDVRIGTAGFGHYMNDDGTSNWIPHLGGVTIGNHVFIGANTIVARGTLSDTIIEDYVMIDALCGICHNSEVHERAIIAGGAGVAGSAIVQEDSWLGPGCIVNAGITVGKGCLIGINSVASHDVPDGKYAFGVPAKIIADNNDKKYKI